MKNNVVKIAPDCVNGQHVWVVYKGWEAKYAWPKNGLTSRQVAEQIAKEWK